MDGAPFIFLIFIAIVIAVIILSILAGAKRKKDLAAWGAPLGLSFLDTKDRGLEHRYPNFSCLRQGDGRYGFNFLRGQWKTCPYESFDYHYETHSTNSKGHRQTHHHHFSAVILQSPVPLRPLLIRPEGFFDKVTEFFGADDIDFESAEFSRKFFVKSPDRRWAYDVLHVRAMEFLLQQPSFYIEFDYGCVIAWSRSTLTPQGFGHAADVISGVLDRLPEYVIRQQAGT